MKTNASIVPGMSTKQQVLGSLKPLTLSGDGFSITLTPCEFSTGSIGWKGPGGMKLDIQGQRTVVSMNLIVAKSKDL